MREPLSIWWLIALSMLWGFVYWLSITGRRLVQCERCGRWNPSGCSTCRTTTSPGAGGDVAPVPPRRSDD